ncbi:MAG: alpha/beta fold hydrolase [Flavobacteriaceae bacterium]|jgi:pimeloyl-ACP methyl ester carboxylesterase|nr:alpha/beta fold hydrolase [Flavobacteriaceae bacterium]
MKTKKVFFSFILCLAFMTSWGQDITGDWNGVLEVKGFQLRLIFHIHKSGDSYSATMESPDQNAKGIPVTSINFEPPTLKLSVSNAGIEYEGTAGADGNITGTFRQRGQSFPLNLTRAPVEKKELRRPQEPAKPYPYLEEEVSFENREAGIRLAGTLTLPKKEGRFPAVVLISGSGAQNRDEELLGHKPFLIIADYLTRNGIAVLRFDDRGTAASTGDFKKATTADFSTDVEAAVKYLLTRKEINQKQIGLIGHSEGGNIAPMVAARSKDIAFIVLLAGTGIPGDKLILLQTEAIRRASGVSEEYLQEEISFSRSIHDLILQSTGKEDFQTVAPARIKELIAKYPAVKPANVSEDVFIDSQIQNLTNNWIWLQYMLKHNPAVDLEKVKCPVLALNGEKDLQVPAKINLEAIRTALLKGGNKKVTIIALPGLNHLFQESETGLRSEYGTIEQTFSPIALQEILKWITAQIN